MAPKKKGENRRRGQDGVIKTGSVPAIGKWQNILSEKEQFSRERTQCKERMRLRTHPLDEPIVFPSDLFGDQTAVFRFIAVNLLRTPTSDSGLPPEPTDPFV